MTDEQINIAIAKACGWKFIADYCHGADQPPEYTTVTPDGRHLCGYYPEYCTDLNAMHEAMLVHPRKDLLRDFLLLEVLDDPTNKTNEPAWATAKQWAKAYLNSLNLQQ